LLKRKIIDTKNESKNKNIGMGFAMFSDNMIVRDFKLMPSDFFLSLYKKRVGWSDADVEFAEKCNMANWKF